MEDTPVTNTAADATALVFTLIHSDVYSSDSFKDNPIKKLSDSTVFHRARHLSIICHSANDEVKST